MFPNESPRFLELTKLWSILPNTGVPVDAGLSGSLSWILLARLCPASLAGLFFAIIAPNYKLISTLDFLETSND